MELGRAVELAEERWAERLGHIGRERGHWIAWLWPEGTEPHEPEEDEWPWTDAHYIESGDVFDENGPVRCPNPDCRQQCQPGQPDPCLGWVPGVDYACCGHGQELGYFRLSDGTTVRGLCNVQDLANWAAALAVRYGGVVE